MTRRDLVHSASDICKALNAPISTMCMRQRRPYKVLYVELHDVDSGTFDCIKQLIDEDKQLILVNEWCIPERRIAAMDIRHPRE